MAALDSCVALDNARLLAAINARHLKREVLALELGVSVRTLRRWLHGDTTQIQRVHLEALAQALQCKPQDLMRGETTPVERNSQHPVIEALQSMLLNCTQQTVLEEATRFLHSVESTLSYEIHAAALFCLGSLAIHLGQPRIAARIFERAIMKADAGKADVIRLQAYLGLTKIDLPGFDTDLYLEHAEHILVRMRATHWQPYLWLAEARRAVRQGDFSRALRLADQSLQNLRGQGTVHDLDYLEGLDIIADAYASVGLHARSLSISGEAAQLAGKNLATRHPIAGRIFSRIANSQRLIGQFAASRDASLSAVDILEQNLGFHHPEVITAWNVLGSAHLELGDLQQSLGAYQEGLERSANLGSERAALQARLRTNMGLAHTRAGELDAAAAAGKAAIQLYQECVGPDHPNTAAAIGRYAITVQARKSFEEAAELFEQSARILKKSDANNVRIMDHVRGQAECLLQLGRYEEAAAQLDRHQGIHAIRDEGPKYRGFYLLLQARACSRIEHRKQEAGILATRARRLLQELPGQSALLQTADAIASRL